MAAGGYPDATARATYRGAARHADARTARCSTPAPAAHDEAVVTNGGRVLCVTALGDTVAEAQQRAYAVCATIRWDGGFYRRDIGYRAIARERADVGQASA